MDIKTKQYDELISDIDRKNAQKNQQDLAQINNLKAELENEQLKKVDLVSVQALQRNHQDENEQKNMNQELQKQLDELKFAYDDLMDEKTQLYLTLTDLKQKEESPSKRLLCI